MTLNSPAILKCIVTALIFLWGHMSQAQWKKAETLTGGSIVSDMITFNGDIYVAMVSGGVFKSSDDGDTWSKVAVPAQPNFVHFAKTATHLLAISYGKTFSTSNGDQWTEGAGPEAFINDVAFDDGSDIFAATHLGIFHSGDGGITWSRNDDAQTHVNTKSIAVSGNTILVGGDAPAAGALIRSDDGGNSWTTTSRGTAAIRDIVISGNDILLNISYDGIYKSSDQGANWQLVRDLTDSEGRLFAASSGLYFFSRYKLYTSANSGNTWSEKSQMIPLYNSSVLYATEAHIFVGLWGGGVVRTTVTGDNDWQLINNGIAVHDINDLVVVGSAIYAGLENSFVRSSLDEGLTWTQKKDTYGLFAGSARAIFSTGSDLFVGSGGGGVQRSSDNGTTWVLKNEGLISKNVLRFASAGNALFVGTDDGVYRSLSKGDTWTKKTGDMPMLRTLYSNGTKVYAGTYNGLFLSNDVGETWTRISTGLPDESIGSMVHIGEVLFAATQFNGLYKTSNSGDSWEKVNSEYVQALATLNSNLFMSTLDNELLLSADSGQTAEDLIASLPPGRVSTIKFTKEQILIGKANSGLWTRKLTEVVPPYLRLYSARNDDKFHVDGALLIESDQTLYSASGIALSDVASYITVTQEDGNLVSYSTQIDVDGKLITLSIAGAVDGEVYTVTIDPLYNESGLASKAISRTFTATTNHIPELSDVFAEAAQGEVLSFNEEMFSAAFTDPDGDPLVSLIVKGLPLHGILKLNNTTVTINQEVASAELDNLVYALEGTFVGEDRWYWSGFDGIDYSAEDVKVIINITAVTAVSREATSDLSVYPNPVSSRLNVNLATAGPFKIYILDAVGRHIKGDVMDNRGVGSAGEVDLSELPPGVYTVRIQSSGGQQFQQKVIKQ